MAFTGSILAALEAGIMPASIPTPRQMNTVVRIIGADKYTGKSSGPDNTKVNR